MLEPQIWHILLTSLLIFLARITDVTLGTFRIICITKAYKGLATFLGFAEILIWLVAINQIMRGTPHILNFIGYASGFALGNYIGIYLEDKLAIGKLAIQMVVQNDSTELIDKLKKNGYGLTKINGDGALGKVDILIIMVIRKQISKVLKIIHHYHPNAFYTITDVQKINAGIFPETSKTAKRKKRFYFNFLRMIRKGK